MIIFLLAVIVMILLFGSETVIKLFGIFAVMAFFVMMKS